MKYMLLIYHDEQSWGSLGEGERQQIYGEYRQFAEQIRSSEQYVSGSELQPTSAATTLRIRNGKHLVTDGPFAETHEQLGGYFLIDARDLDEALGLAARVPSARTGSMEVRPLSEGSAPSA